MTIQRLTQWTIRGGLVSALCVTTALQAQVDTTRRDTSRTRTDTARARSTQVIPIRKESRGEVVLPVTSTRPRTDSAALADSVRRASQARNDSINNAELARQDSIQRAERQRADSAMLRSRGDSVANAARMDSLARLEQARTDSISRAEQARADSIARVNPVAGAAVVNEQNFPAGPQLPKTFFIGFAAGTNSPMGDFEDLGYGNGLNITVPFGWHNPNSLFGVRFTLAYSQFSGSPFTTGGASPIVLSNPDPKVYSADVNLNMRFPFNERRTSSVYLFGGGGLYMFRNYGMGSALGAYLGNDVLDPSDSDNESTLNKWGMNGGAGIEFGIGTSSLFLESRLVNVFAGRDDEPNFDSAFGERGTSVRWVPLILGFTIR
jgi:hypothetical protein